MWLHSSVGRASHRYRGGHGFESRWSLDFFRLLLSNCLNWKIYCDDHSSLCSTTAVQIYELFHMYFTSFHSSREIWTARGGWLKLNKLISLPMFGFIAQLVEHRTGIAEVTGSNPVEVLILSGFFFPIAWIGNLLRWSFFTFRAFQLNRGNSKTLASFWFLSARVFLKHKIQNAWPVIATFSNFSGVMRTENISSFSEENLCFQIPSA